MDEQELRKAIRNEIKKSLTEASFLDRAKSSVTTRTSQVANLSSVKLLKKALSQGSTDQKAAGILNVVKELSDGDASVLEKVRYRLQQKSVRGSMGSTDEV